MTFSFTIGTSVGPHRYEIEDAPLDWQTSPEGYNPRCDECGSSLRLAFASPPRFGEARCECGEDVGSRHFFLTEKTTAAPCPVTSESGDFYYHDEPQKSSDQ
jgi:hypothetical protein